MCVLPPVLCGPYSSSRAPCARRLFQVRRQQLVDPTIVKRKCFGPDSALPQISENGFTVKRSTGQQRPGMYFADTLTVDLSVRIYDLLVCDVAVGRSLNYDQDPASLDPDMVHAAGFDSVHLSEVHGPGYLIYNAAQVALGAGVGG